jgi:hypothetical protein
MVNLARQARTLAELIEPDRVALVAPLMLMKFGFILRFGNRHMIQSADRIEGAFSVESVRKVWHELMDHDASFQSYSFVVDGA